MPGPTIGFSLPPAITACLPPPPDGIALAFSTVTGACEKEAARQFPCCKGL